MMKAYNDIQTSRLSAPNLFYLLLFIGLGGICGSLMGGNLIISGVIAILPFAFILGVYILRMPVTLLYVIFIINYFIMGITRYLPLEGISVLMDLLYALSLLMICLHGILFHNIEWKRAINTLTITSFIWAIYCVAQLANPTGVLEGWILSRGLIINGLIISVIAALLCTRYKTLKTLLFLLSVLTLLAFGKALIQKYRGFDSYELEWLKGNTTHIIHSGIRYFSFFTDASNLGSNMGAAILIFGISALHLRNRALSTYYIIVAFIATYTLFLTGTRGAIIVPLAGLALYTIISKQAKTMVAGGLMLISVYIFFAFTMIGQNNSMIRRMRTAFSPSKDASLNVRKENQRKLGEYLKYRPFGEGLGLSGDGLGVKVSKRFTTSIPTDSWYVKIWVETGVIGLVLYMGMILITIGRGAWILMFRIRDPELKGLLTGLLCGIFGMFVSAYGNSFWGQFPTMIISFMGMTFVLNGEHFDKEIHQDKQISINTSDKQIEK